MRKLALVAGVASLAFAQPGLAIANVSNAAAIPMPAGGFDAGDVLRGLAQKGLVSLLTAFTNIGTSVVTNRIIQAGTAATRTGWGTGTTTAAITQTDLVTEAAETLSGGRVAGTESRVTTTNTNDTYQVAATVTATGTRAITEAALFDANSSGATVPNATGTMLIRGDFAAVNVVTGDSIAFTFKLKFVSNAA